MNKLKLIVGVVVGFLIFAGLGFFLTSGDSEARFNDDVVDVQTGIIDQMDLMIIEIEKGDSSEEGIAELNSVYDKTLEVVKAEIAKAEALDGSSEIRKEFYDSGTELFTYILTFVEGDLKEFVDLINIPPEEVTDEQADRIFKLVFENFAEYESEARRLNEAFLSAQASYAGEAEFELQQ